MQYIPTISELVYEYGLELFGSTEAFNRWLNCEMLYLGGKRPMDLPPEELLEELSRIEDDSY